jgi:membrane fusion protein, epimerase transport system
MNDNLPVSDSAWRPALAGWLIIALFFGGLGYWAAVAPLNGAVVASGLVKVESSRKSVQHLDGGIVRELRVKDGDHVDVGDTLIVLDDTQARAEFAVLSDQYAVLRASEVRLLTELAGGETMEMPADLAERADDLHVAGIWTGQLNQFDSRRTALAGQRRVIGQKIEQFKVQIVGAEAQVRAYRRQLDSVHAEADDIAPLVEKMLLPRPRLLQLQRTAFSLEGQIADAEAGIAKSRQAIAEQELQIAQLTNDHMAEVTRDLREIQARLVEVMPKRTNALAVLGRMEIRAPYAGRVVGLNVFSVGGVIQRGEKILDIVPDEDGLTVELQVAVEDIADVHLGGRAELQLPSYKQATLQGDVVHVSADRLTDSRTGAPYFVAAVRPDRAMLAELPGVQLTPGMAVTALIPTESRTALEYLISPLTTSFSRAFRQR